MSSTMCLRAAVHQLSSTPTKDLPFLATYLASTLGDCAAVLSASDSRKSSGDQDTYVLVQKLKARVTSLLQDRTVEGRWTAIVLAKSIVEAGQWEVLRGCEHWARGLLGILNKPDPLPSKELCIITLTRIFCLTHRYPTLMREITTPILPSYITACLGLLSAKPLPQETKRLKRGLELLEPVLCSFIKLLPSHPTIFRPFSSRIHDLVLPLIDSIHAPSPVREFTVELAQRIFVSLHHCAPKNTTGDEWLKACKATIFSIHHTGSHLFRAIVEQWEPTDPIIRELPRSRGSSGDVGDDGTDPLGLPTWTGIREGAEKVTGLLKLLSNFILSQTNSTVAVPLGLILDLTSRLTSLCVPLAGDHVASIINPEIARNEREALWSELPRIHVATVDLLRDIVETFGIGTVSISQSCIEQALYVFEAERFNRQVRAITYRLVSAALSTMGFSVSKADVTALFAVIRMACHDIEGPVSDNRSEQLQRGSNKDASNVQKTSSNNADAFLKFSSKMPTNGSTSDTAADTTGAAASDLLCTFLSNVPADLIPAALRAEVDRTAILFQQGQMMLASVLHPALGSGRQRSNASIMPFLARSNPHGPEVEGILRPRMPVLLDRGTKKTLPLDTYEDNPDLVIQDDNVINKHDDAEHILATPDIVLSEAPSLNTGDNVETTNGIRSKRTYEAEAGDSGEQDYLANTGVASKKARTELNQPSHINHPGISKSVTELSFLKPCAAGTEESRKTTPPPMTTRGETPVSQHETVAEHAMASNLSASKHISAQPGATDEASEESDDEIPQLNIEPDTDDEDEEAMVE